MHLRFPRECYSIKLAAFADRVGLAFELVRQSYLLTGFVSY